jgi:hypothetical protein
MDTSEFSDLTDRINSLVGVYGIAVTGNARFVRLIRLGPGALMCY